MALAIFAYQYYTAKNEPPKVDDLPRPWASGTAASIPSSPSSTPSSIPTAKQPVTTVAKPPIVAKPSVAAKPPVASTKAAAKPSVRRNVTLRDEDGQVIYRGEIDLGPSLERVAAGRKLRFSHDGTTFQNREGRLPRKAPGYYEEWVVPTPGEGGPGPQRLVVGADGDVWYTPDHYRNFERIPSGLPATPASAR
ncbi:MAG: hypothetical protein C0483_05715 [Pirellula sp.]|nr:hypothetical protein [Pirellula sp.]